MRIQARTLDLPAAEGARSVTLGLLDGATRAATALAAGSGDDPLHDFRVAVRRLRSALRTFRPWLDGIRRRDRRRLRRLARATNAARDAEVQIAWLAARRPRLSSPSQRAALAVAIARLEATRREGPEPGKVAARFLKAAGKLQGRLGRQDPGPARSLEPGGRFCAVLAALVVDHLATLAARLTEVRGPDDAEAVHAARIAAKRLRYLLEPLAGLPAADATEAVARLKELQDVLGDLHDAHLLAERLGELLAEARRDGWTGPRPRAGLLAIARLLRARRDALFATLERRRRAAGLAGLEEAAGAIAAALGARPVGASRPRPGSAGAGRPSRAP